MCWYSDIRIICFFFSSRRRHTRCSRDWSSDVCSSDLELVGFATPRRLAVWVKRLAAQQPEQHLKRRGPPLSAALDAAGRPTRAALGFAESCGTSLEALQRLDEGKGTFLFFLGTKAGERAVVLLPGLVP